MKKNIKEQDASKIRMNDDAKLLAAKDKCFPKEIKWVNNGNPGNFRGGRVLWGQNTKDETVVFFSDLSAEITDSKDKSRIGKKVGPIPCKALELSVGTTSEQSSYTPDQRSYIESIIKSEGVVQIKPSSYETEKGKWEVIDLNKRNSKLFPEPGKYLVYKQKGELNVTSPQQDKIITALEGQGYQKDQPNANESDLYIKVNLQTIENGKYTEYFSQPFFMYQPIKDVNIEDLLSQRRKKFDDQKVDIKQCRQTIDILHTAYVKKYKLEDSERIALKTYAQRCSDQVKNIFGAQKKLETLMNLDPKDPSKLSLKLKNENVFDIKNLVRESLIEVSQNRKRMLTEERSIVKTRLNLLTENVNIKSKKDREKFCNDLLNEMIYLNRQGFQQEVISEGFFDMIKGLFGNAGDAIMGTFKETFANWLLKNLGIDTNGWIAGTIVKTIGNIHIGDIPKLTECSFITHLISKSIAEEAIDKLKNTAGLEGKFYDFLRNDIVEALSSSDLGSKIENSLGQLICPSLSGIKEKMETAASDMKEKALATS